MGYHKMGGNRKNDCNDKARERALKLVRYLVDEKVDPELHSQLFDWFGELREGGTGEQVFAEFAAGSAQPNMNPDSREWEQFRELQRRLGLNGEDGRKPVRSKTLSRRRFILRAAAVVIPFFVITGAIWFAWERGDKSDVSALAASEVIIEVCEDVQKDVYLPDSTQVWVNSGSKLTVSGKFADARSVTLEGEAYFDVKHDEEKPFSVKTEKLQVRVLGTKFNVVEDSDARTTQVTLYEGSVEVTDGVWVERLAPNQRLTYHHDSGRIRIENFEPETVEASDWRSDVMYAKGRTLPELFRIIGNYYDVKILFDESDFTDGEHFITAFGKEDTVGKLLDVIRQSSGMIFNYTVQGETIIINKTEKPTE